MIGHTKFITNRLLEQTDNKRKDFRLIDLFGNIMIQLTMSCTKNIIHINAPTKVK